MKKTPIEPSDIERGELPETSAAYMADLETEKESLHEQVLHLELENKRLSAILQHHEICTVCGETTFDGDCRCPNAEV